MLYNQHLELKYMQNYTWNFSTNFNITLLWRYKLKADAQNFSSCTQNEALLYPTSHITASLRPLGTKGGCAVFIAILFCRELGCNSVLQLIEWRFKEVSFNVYCCQYWVFTHHIWRRSWKYAPYGRRTFYCVNHKILVAKLHFYGIRGESEDWIRSYLTNTRQKVEENNLIQLKIFLWLGYTETWSSSRINSRNSIVHNIYKWPSPHNKFYIRTSIISWWY